MLPHVTANVTGHVTANLSYFNIYFQMLPHVAAFL